MRKCEKEAKNEWSEGTHAQNVVRHKKMPLFPLGPMYCWMTHNGQFYAAYSMTSPPGLSLNDRFNHLLREIGASYRMDEKHDYLTDMQHPDAKFPLAVTTFERAMNLHIKRDVIDRFVNEKWRGKKMVAEYFYWMKMMGRALPTTVWECKQALVDMLDMHAAMEKALRCTVTVWRDYMDVEPKIFLFRALNLDSRLFQGKGMSRGAFTRRFLAREQMV